MQSQRLFYVFIKKKSDAVFPYHISIISMPLVMQHYTSCGRWHKTTSGRCPSWHCPSHKSEFFPRSVSPAVTTWAQTVRRNERRTGLPLLATGNFRPGVNTSYKGSPIIKAHKIVFLTEKNLHWILATESSKHFFIPTLFLEYIALGWSFSVFWASVLALEMIPFPQMQDNLCHWTFWHLAEKRETCLVTRGFVVFVFSKNLKGST